MKLSGKPTTGRPKRGSPREGRSKQINIRLSEDDLRALDELASFYAATRTDTILMLIESEIKLIRRNKK